MDLGSQVYREFVSEIQQRLLSVNPGRSRTRCAAIPNPF